MKRNAKIMSLLLAVLMVLTVLAGCAKDPENPEDTDKEQPANTVFEPKLDTTKAVTIDAAVFFGNFEAFDQVINHFNEFYPNVTINYERYSDTSGDFLKINPNIDILMTSNERGVSFENLVDLIAAGVDVSGIADNVVEGCKWNDTLYSIPMSLNLKGLVVNKNLLAKEGLSVPQTLDEFLNVLEALKQKGYTPIQGPNAAVGTLCYNMGMAMLANDPALLEAVKKGDETGATALKAVYERMQDFVDKGYINAEVNATYPENNYEEAILKFFEGDVPFWVCDTEKVSGMKKRESKSEAFKANPFGYEFILAPIGSNGAYKYIEPWYGFAVNKDSDVKDYSIEFLRFMARGDELNTLASVKGVPSVSKVSDNARYANIGSTKSELVLVADGSVPVYCGTFLSSIARELLDGTQTSPENAWKHFLEMCAEASKES